ncbi:MAG: tol-pal system protein YbgF [Gemmatimonadota bacterium]|nr:MAG: tol-pal system protein YbgF [Gemmatimonadota bacterium]
MRVLTRGTTFFLTILVTGACATRRDVDRIRDDIAALQARQDSIAASIGQLERSVSQALENQQSLVFTVRGDLLRQLDDMERQLVEIQELLGQSQVELYRMRDRIEERQAGRQALGDTLAGADSLRVDTGQPAAGAAGDPRAYYSAAIEQFRRGAYETARTGFQEFLVANPAHELAPDAQYYLAETYREEGDAGRAVREYSRVVELYPNSRAAPTALYKAGLVQVEQGNIGTACEYFQRVTAGYPRSDESRLARQQAERLSCR